MKYSFRLYSTGPKTKIKVHWGVPLNLQACPKCKALNHKMATLCSKCGQPFPESGIPASNPVTGTAPEVAPAAVAAHDGLGPSKAATIQAPIPDTSSPSLAMASNASAAQAASTPEPPGPDMPMAYRQFAISNEQKWLRRIWGVALLASVAIPLLIVVISLQPPSAPPPSTKNAGSKTGGSVVIPPPLESMPAAAAEQQTLPVIPDKALAVADPVVAPETAPVLAEPEPPIPTPNKPGKPAALPQTAKFTGKHAVRAAKKPARIHTEKAAPVASGTPKVPTPRPRAPVAPANAPCSDAARALALCNTN